MQGVVDVPDEAETWGAAPLEGHDEEARGLWMELEVNVPNT